MSCQASMTVLSSLKRLNRKGSLLTSAIIEFLAPQTISLGFCYLDIKLKMMDLCDQLTQLNVLKHSGQGLVTIQLPNKPLHAQVI